MVSLLIVDQINLFLVVCSLAGTNTCCSLFVLMIGNERNCSGKLSANIVNDSSTCDKQSDMLEA